MVTRRAQFAVLAVFLTGCREAAMNAPKVTWKTLRGLDVKTGNAPDEVKRLDGTVVQIAGYMVPRHEDSGFQMTEFLLVPYPNTSSDFPPPPQNEIVLVRMDGGSINFTPDAIWVQGRFSIAPAKSHWGPVIYHLSAKATQPYKD